MAFIEVATYKKIVTKNALEAELTGLPTKQLMTYTPSSETMSSGANFLNRGTDCKTVV